MPNEQLEVQVQSPLRRAELNHWHEEENISQGGEGRGGSEDSRLEEAVMESPGK